ncbi:hypothetical protein [Lactiplantibacillus paraxiangfangensis]|uniref:hypothetical protein n=1 Tax=Lactiplantibacillus paraxiangfangensis TaxID=3076224 RepID=UPI0030C78517
MVCGRGTGPSLRSGLAPRPEHLQKAQLFWTVRGVGTEKNAGPNTTITTDAISASLRLFDNSEVDLSGVG